MLYLAEVSRCSLFVQQRWSRRRDLRLWRRAYKYGGTTTSWSRTASRQDKAGAHFPFGKHAAPMSAAPFPERLLHIRSGALIIQRAWQWDARGRKLRSPQQSKTGTGKNLFPFLVEATGFEPTTSWSRTKRATNLRYASATVFIITEADAFCKRFFPPFRRYRDFPKFYRLSAQKTGRGSKAAAPSREWTSYVLPESPDVALIS